MEYNILIQLPKTRKPQNYELTVKFRSLAQFIVDSVKNKNLRRYRKINTALYKIKYVDYVVGQSLMDLTGRWFDSLNIKDINPIVKYIKDNQLSINSYIELVITLTGLVYIYILTVIYIGPIQEIEISMLIKPLILAAGIFVTSIFLAKKIGKMLSVNSTKLYPLSYIKLNRGDERVIKSYKRINLGGIFKGTISIIFSILLGVTSSLIAWSITS